jgi:hypothetical protein
VKPPTHKPIAQTSSSSNHPLKTFKPICEHPSNQPAQGRGTHDTLYI